MPTPAPPPPKVELPRTSTVPLSVFVVFHPDCKESEALAEGLFRWFRLQSDDGDATEVGLPVWYRCLPKVPDDRVPKGQTAEIGLYPEIKKFEAELNVVVVLVSDRMVRDATWREALEKDLAGPLAKQQRERVEWQEKLRRWEAKEAASEAPGDRPQAPLLVLPVAVDNSLYRLAFLYQHIQPIRIGEPEPLEEELVQVLPIPLDPPTELAWRAADADRQARKKANEEATKARRLKRSGLLQRGVMEAMIGALPEHPGSAVPSRIKVFISHAKRDGTEVAEQVRDRLASQGQLEAWYDANELPAGYAWEHPLEAAAERNTAALVAVVSDAYATRYWCRREVQVARTPRRLKVPKTANEEARQRSSQVWRVQPALGLIVPGGGYRRPMDALSQVVHLGWKEAEAQGDAVTRMVDRLLLEVLLSRFHQRLCAQICDPPNQDPRYDEHTLYLTFVPSPWTLTCIRGELGTDAGLPTRIAYPGFGLRSAELEELREVAARLGWANPEILFVTHEELSACSRSRGANTKQAAKLRKEAKFRKKEVEQDLQSLSTTFEKASAEEEVARATEILDHRGDVRGPRAALQALRRADCWTARGKGTSAAVNERCLVVLSAGGSLKDMAPAGADAEHADDIVVRLSRRLLRTGWRLSFGGTLGNLKANITGSLLEVARTYANERNDLPSTQRQPARASDLKNPPLINYSAWPNTKYLNDRTKSDLVGICDFREVKPAGALGSVLAEQLHRLSDPLTAWLGAQALTEMRQASSKDPKLRVVVGGKVRNWSGWLPGIAEEVEASMVWDWPEKDLESEELKPQNLRFHRPFVILGTLGGCAGLLASYLSDSTREWPKALGFDAAMREDPSFQCLLQHDGARLEAHRRFAVIERRFAAFRDHLNEMEKKDKDAPLFEGDDSPTSAEFRVLLELASATDTINLILKITQRMMPASTSGSHGGQP